MIKFLSDANSIASNGNAKNTTLYVPLWTLSAEVLPLWLVNIVLAFKLGVITSEKSAKGNTKSRVPIPSEISSPVIPVTLSVLISWIMFFICK